VINVVKTLVFLIGPIQMGVLLLKNTIFLSAGLIFTVVLVIDVTVPVQLQLCEWVESYSYFTINDINLNETVVSLTSNLLQTPNMVFCSMRAEFSSAQPIGFICKTRCLITRVKSLILDYRVGTILILWE
jgi:hypothetical protein